MKNPDTTCTLNNAVAIKFIQDNLMYHRGLGLLFFVNDNCSSCILELILLLKTLKETAAGIPIYLVHKHNDFVLVEYYMNEAKVVYDNIYKYNYYQYEDEQFDSISENSNDIFLIYNNQLLFFIE